MIIDKQQDARDEKIMRAALEAFFDQWAPRDPSCRDRFHADLHMLVARMAVHAQKPFLKMLESSMARQVPNPLYASFYGDPSSQ